MHLFEHGTQPTKLDKRDYSYHKTFGSIIPPSYPESLDLDAGFGCPNQNMPNEYFGIPALPAGCTEYTVNEICGDEDKARYNPGYTESKIHASANGGTDMRVAFNSPCEHGVQLKEEATIFEALGHKRAAYFRVGQSPDYFDGIRLALHSNNRPVGLGTPWYAEWSAAAAGNKLTLNPDGTFNYSVGDGTRSGIMPKPFNPRKTDGLTWHAWKVAGWKTINGVPYLIGKVWAGENVGDNGWLYFDRETINAVMAVFGSAAFTLAKATPAQIKTVGVTYVFKRNLAYGVMDIENAELQKALISLGYAIQHATTTYFGNETRAALAHFQADNGIDDDGTHFGPLTRYAMNRVLNPAQSIFGSIAIIIQTFLGL